MNSASMGNGCDANATPHPDFDFVMGREYWIGVQAGKVPRAISTKAGNGTIWLARYQAYPDFEHDGSCVHIRGHDRLLKYFEPLV